MTLSTIHSAKGLEFDYVYIIDPLEGVLPSTMAIERHLSRDPELLEEETRLFYVAITRARELLILVGDEDVVAHMTANDRQQRRYSGLRWRLAQLANG